MEQLINETGIAVPFVRPNIDTDQLMPSTYFFRVQKEGYAGALFGNQRWTQDGSPNPDFILNRAPWNKATIMLAGDNFGCGSSREGAAKALRENGFRAVIAPSFGGIFYNNCFRNGIAPVELPLEAIEKLASRSEESQGACTISVDLDAMEVTTSMGDKFSFTLPEVSRQMLLSGEDEIDTTLRQRDAIEAYREQDRRKRPWVYAVTPGKHA
jgi:3-isopropylmalate/(R)-2-methylmalate dehydratase small subunit